MSLRGGRGLAQRVSGRDVAVDAHGELPIEPVDTAGSKTALELGDGIQPDQPLLRGRNQQPAERGRIVALTGHQPHGDGILLGALFEGGDLVFARHQQPDCAGDIGHTDTQVGGELAIDIDLHSGLFRFRFALTSVSEGSCIILTLTVFAQFDERLISGPSSMRADRGERVASAERVGESDSGPGVGVFAERLHEPSGP